MVIYQHLRLVLFLLVSTHLLCDLPVTATCFRNGKSYEQCKDCLLKAADCHKQNRSYPFQVYIISHFCIVLLFAAVHGGTSQEKSCVPCHVILIQWRMKTLISFISLIEPH
jgi:hypothetical protein